MARAARITARTDFNLAHLRATVTEGEAGACLILQTDGWPDGTVRGHASMFLDGFSADQLQALADHVRGLAL